MKPRDRVRAHLRELLANTQVCATGRLPSIQQTAARLKVSTSTVQAVMRELAANGQVRGRVGSGTYLVSDRMARKEYRIALGCPLFSTKERSNWTYEIYAGIMEQLHQIDCAIDLIGIPKTVRDDTAYLQALLEIEPKVHGVIITPMDAAVGRQIREVYAMAGKPVVSANPPEESATTNFVSTDYFQASAMIGRAFRAGGRRKVAYVDPFIEVSTSGHLRWYGLQTGLGLNPKDGEGARVVVPKGHSADEVAASFSELMTQGGWVPDAVYGSGDEVALWAVRALRKAKLAIPTDVGVVGGLGTELSTTDCPLMTRMRQPLHQIGCELLKMLIQRIDHSCAPAPGMFIETPFIGGATTLSEENALLGIKA